MAATSVTAAFRDQYLTITGAPTLYLFDAPPQVDGAQVFPAYAVLTDDGLRASYEFELTVLEVTGLTLMVYADTLSAVDAYVELIKYNGGGLLDGLGMDFCTLDVDVKYTNMQVERLSETRFVAEQTGRSAQRIFGCKMEYRVSLYRVAGGD